MTRLSTLIDEYLQDMWSESPVNATADGADGYDDTLGDFSAEGFRRREQKAEDWLRRFAALGDETLDRDGRIDRDLVASQLRGVVLMRERQEWRRSPDAYWAPCLYGVFLLFAHKLRPEAELIDVAAARLRQVPSVLEHARTNIDPELAVGRFAGRAQGGCAAAAVYARSLLPGEVSEGPGRETIAEAGEIAARAFDDFQRYLGELAATAGDDWAIGTELYSGLLREQQMLTYGAPEMHERGKEAYAALAEEMRTLAAELGYDDWRVALTELSSDHAADPEGMRADYERATADARAFVARHGLVTLPAGEECAVVAAPPFQRPMLAVASYMPPPPLKASLRGHFFVPFPPDGAAPEDVRGRLADNNRHAVPTTTAHEAYPGHHWHLVHVAARCPRTIRKLVWSPYFGEGWGLYAELVMREHGFFDDPRAEFFHVEARLFRAARIVVDTALHTGTMTFDEAVRFMEQDAGRTHPVAVAEVTRYCSWPTQAPAYLTGCLEIERIRDRWSSQVGGELRTFHDAIASNGAMPIELTERALFG